MKRFALATLSVLALASFASSVSARPVSGDSNPSDRYNTTVDTSEIINPTQVKANPPSGDANPSDRYNTTVDTSEIINPTKGAEQLKGNPPSGDNNPSDRLNRTVTTSVITPVPGTR